MNQKVEKFLKLLLLKLAVILTLAVVATAVTLTAIPNTAQASQAAAAPADAATINPAARGELRVVKSAGDPFTQFGDPTNPGAPVIQQPVAGIEFNIQKISGFDLTTNEGWRQAQALDDTKLVPGGSEAYRLGEKITASTNSEGVAVFSDLDLGLYYVTESPKPAQNQGLTVLSPFVVAVPTTDVVDRATWLYSVTVHAKDQRLAASKTANRRCAAVGDTVEYGISATVPAPTRDGRISRYQIVDVLPADTSLVPDTSTVILTDTYREAVNTELTVGSDFEVTTEGGLARLSLKDAGLSGLAALRENNPGVVVTWRFELKIDQRPEDGTLENIAYLLTEGYPEFDPTIRPGVPTNEVEVGVPCITPTPTATPTEKPGNSTPTTVPTTRVEVPVPGPGIPQPSQSVLPQSPTAPTTPPGDLRSALAQTGANTLWVMGIGLGMLLLGALILAASKRKRDE
ncbi:SpaH/EbpB family LPXTG-anchored major pilin [Corynebacterium callunae]|uniref:SpaH/EbpB family LPXTG-anchored major pilin n=1 Tax=Corynebacterium callunae TaxID=1721 RepID=UPI0039826357